MSSKHCRSKHGTRVTLLNAKRDELWSTLKGLCDQWNSDYTSQNEDALKLVSQIVYILDKLIATLTRSPTSSFRKRLIQILGTNGLYQILEFGYDKHRGRPSAIYFKMPAYNWPDVDDTVSVPVCKSDGSITLVNRKVSYIGIFTFTVYNETDLSICGSCDMPS